jgi:hypothetical protein
MKINVEELNNIIINSGDKTIKITSNNGLLIVGYYESDELCSQRLIVKELKEPQGKKVRIESEMTYKKKVSYNIHIPEKIKDEDVCEYIENELSLEERTNEESKFVDYEFSESSSRYDVYNKSNKIVYGGHFLI